MSKLESLLEDFEKAVLRLKEVLAEKKTDIVRDSAIKRFELVFDLAWKTVKECLEENHNVICASPKTCFREAYKQKLIEYDNFWIQLANERNKTVHAYEEEIAEEVYALLPKALVHFQEILEKIKNQV